MGVETFVMFVGLAFYNDTRPDMLRHVTVAAQCAFKGSMTH